MTRDEAVKIAASSLPLNDTMPWDGWAASVVAGADALLAAMGEPHVGQSSTECASCETRAAATEARVVREIVSWLRADRLHITALEVERGDWRAKGK